MENVNIVYACHSCQKELSSCRSLRDHLIKVHKLNFEFEQIYQKRGKNFDNFISKKYIDTHPELEYTRRFECSSCRELFGCIEELGEHFCKHIQPKNPKKRPVKEGTSSNSSSSNSSKKKVSLNKGKKLHTFDCQLISKINIQNGPKFTLEDMKRLSPMYSFRFQGARYPASSDIDVVIANNQQEQRRLTSLNRHPESLRILRLALNCKDVDELEDFHFGKVPVTASKEERGLFLCIRHTLQDFVSKCRRKAATVPTNHERTFFFDRVMPIINYFADNSGAVYFEWGEKKIMSRQAVTLSVALSQTSSPNYADGIGYSTTVDVLDEERIMIECSSGGREENIQHTYGDSLKLVESLTSMLVLKAYRRCNANFETFIKFKTVGIQCVKRTLTLFILSMNEQKKLVVEERRSANVPISFNEIFDWMQVFELVAHLQVSIFPIHWAERKLTFL
ncbi:hypothetical protein BDB00DRAFT_849955 [Zychaea mexicana]|uniref:uncharacterized protein n=1 Tax=Zychaea mexicana TaxID=64656 RepID=UPI0022FE8679|nr:uncharacterized protein BDB00DRAFT_849955 [Zychaea mexicana]KAI9488091.1 hypothetical protein BDB00DRAFT_849955 [Zychaea mexicana]